MKKSKGHICFWKGFEFFERNGDVFRANTHNPIQTFGARHGRWECSRAHFDHYRAVIVPESVS